MGIDKRIVYFNTPIERYECITTLLKLILEEIINQYNSLNIVDKYY